MSENRHISSNFFEFLLRYLHDLIAGADLLAVGQDCAPGVHAEGMAVGPALLIVGPRLGRSYDVALVFYGARSDWK